MIFLATIPPFFAEVAILLVLAALIAYMGYRLKLVPIVGFLLTGVIIGPNALGLVANQELVDATAQIGVILLLFTIGIEFSLEKLMRIKNLVFGAGLLQVVITSGLTLLILMAFGVSWQAGLFTGFLVALSSTAIVLKLLGSKGETNTEPGQASLGILIFQDLSIIVMVLLVPMLAGEMSSSSDIFVALGKAGVIIVVALFGARRVMPYILERVAKTCSQELFLLALIAICFGMALLASLAGVSLELGAFLAGLIVSESRFSEHAFGEILPLQILFSATFFVSVGMLLDIGFVFANLPLVLGIVVAVLVLKLLATTISIKVLGYSTATAVTAGFFLAQVGEFSFVLERAGRELNLFPAGMEDTGSKAFIAATVVLMVLTPTLSQFGRKMAARFAGPSAEPVPDEGPMDQPEESRLPDEHENLQNHVVLAGYGAAARSFSRLLKSAQIPQVVVTLSPERAREAEAQGILVLRGDPGRQNALRHARLAYAKLLFIPDDDPELAHRVTRVARTLNPTVRIIARSRSYQPAEELQHAGTDLVVADEHEVVAQLFAEMLRDYQVDPAEIENCLSIVKEAGYQCLRDASRAQKLAPIGSMIRGTHDTRTVTIRENAPIIGMTIEAVHFEQKGLAVKLLKRGTMEVNRPHSELTLRAGDHITLAGDARDFAACSTLFAEPANGMGGHEVTRLSSVARAQEIHLYGTDWCLLTGGFKTYFKRHDLSYTFHNIEEDKAAEEAVKEMNKGKIKFPMVVVGEVVMKNPPIEELEAALEGRQAIPS